MEALAYKGRWVTDDYMAGLIEQEFADTVAAGETLCIVEAMKLMNEIAAEEMGTVREVCLSDATPVEYGTVLFYVEPHDPTPGA